MLFGYPVEAITENWFHDCLFEILQTIHDHLNNGTQLPAWPMIIPDAYRDTLRTRTGLRDRLKTYREKVSDLNYQQRNQIFQALIDQNQIEQLLSGDGHCASLGDLPEIIREPVKNLFEFSFELLTDLKIRDHQYEIIYISVFFRLCPFCGCEYFDAPGSPREALDHYLAESKYPFAATNLHNLVPMGHKCNSKYKLADNILYNGEGQRRRAFYPYNLRNNQIRVSLENSTPFAGTQGLFPLPQWQIDLRPDIEEVSTWDAVFHIKERYQRDILDAEFFSWLREFSAWCNSISLNPATDQDIINALERYSSYMDTLGFRDRAFLKGPVFRMLLQNYQQGNERVKTFIQGIVIGGMP